MVLIVLCLGIEFVLFAPYVRFHILVRFGYTCWEIATYSAYDMLSKFKYMYQIVNLVFSHHGLCSGICLLITLCPDHCLLVSFC